MGSTFTFHKHERLTNRSVIQTIFRKEGQMLRSGPLMMVYLEQVLNTPAPAQVLISVSKRRFKKAHDRNRIKRLLKEVYRLHKAPLYHSMEAHGKQFALALIYQASDLPDFVSLESHFKRIVHDFVEDL